MRLVERVAQHLGVGSPWLIQGVVTTHIKDVWLFVANLAKDFLVLFVPTVEPLGFPVVLDVIAYLVVPIHIQIYIDEGYVKVCVCRIVQVKLRLTVAGSKEQNEETKTHPGPPCEGGKLDAL